MVWRYVWRRRGIWIRAGLAHVWQQVSGGWGNRAKGSAIKGNEQRQRRTEVDLFFMESLAVCEDESSRGKELHPGGMAALFK